ncbi:MAG: SH3 domain-containing protein [Labilithrix sp.]|nr:SH3 domain-containing protein [Labilithrix sp.]MCW5816325.1 SH3 domain-containing protein [Labilithrix sp.]
MRLGLFLLVCAALGACAVAPEDEAGVSDAALGACSKAQATSALNLRATPGPLGSLIKTMPAGTAVDVLEIVEAGEAQGWARVRAGADEGWAKATYLECAEERPVLHAVHVDADVAIDGAVEPAWGAAPPATFDTDWSGKTTATKTTVRALWSEHALYMLFVLEGAGFHVDRSRPISVERDKLYEEDCVEVFLAPDPAQRKKYYEIELGPYGHWFDLAIDRDRGTSDVRWSSGAQIATHPVPEAKVAIIEVALRSPDVVRALKRGASLPMNMFRMEGKSPRQYLAWSPTKTPRPNFHVPEAFGTLVLE